ncbi:GntR family transcriptional regulator [Arthrobacter sp. 7749]|uniref:FadR family transcriptional regulator n=1 Tax=Paeniglutamicibacter terrestris TaxID=2723403 RepID=A0ABX1G0V3_9MICC|nr:GntR family transcriptional regulator [Arthrobacter sp. 7749]NKG19584.1 FadR family transcriptional regulator [Paeniglutamicibacter terrestris]
MTWGQEAVSNKEKNPAQPARAYETVLTSIEADLRAGKIKIGDQLPGERSLAETHGISRASVRDAIRILDAMGMVRTSSGSGPNSGAVVISDPAIGLSATLRMHVASRQLSVADIVESRILLETWAAQSADLTRDPARSAEVLRRTSELLEAMDEPGLDREEFHDLDSQFHVLLSSLAGNAVIESMMESLRLSISDYVSESVANDAAWQKIATVLRAQHHGIHQAVSDANGALASELLREHIQWFYTESAQL